MYMKMVLGAVIAFGLGAVCRWLSLPVPAPPTAYGAFLVCLVTAGYIVLDWLLRS